jgi:uncharacterized protein
MNNNALIIFTRNPELGKVKTRLAATIGNEKALIVYQDLLRHTMNATKKLSCDKFVFYDQNIVDNDIWDDNIYNKKLQNGSDLGIRMKNAFETLLNLGYKKCIIIGSDLFDLEQEHIDFAFQKLENSNVVIGPAEDGGYYLLGLKNIIPKIFVNKTWGTNTVLVETLKNLENYSIHFLETLNDIDTEEDLLKSKHYLNLN